MKTHMRKLTVALVLGAALASMGCTVRAEPKAVADTATVRPRNKDSTRQAQAVLEGLFKAVSAKDAAAVEGYLSPGMRGADWGFGKLDRVEFGPITSEADPDVISSYMESGIGSVTHTKLEDIQCFRADITDYYKPGMAGPSPDGVALEWWWFLERQADGGWLVTSWGF